MNKKALLLKFLVGLLLGLIVFIPVIIKACSVLPLGIDYKNEELRKVTGTVNDILNSDDVSRHVVVRFPEDAVLYGVAAGKETSILREGGSETHFTKGANCGVGQACLCYCEDYYEVDEAGKKIIVCGNSDLVCKVYDSMKLLHVEGFFDGSSDYIFEGGFAIGREFGDGVSYRTDILIQETQEGIAFCMKKGVICV